ncbi:ApbE family lipoprotein [Desulfovibrio sp. X2]|uniref:FAD:protein FMN transferase n=1 Tax=Desulfovibrio sp. X2 TaxID=941449 RepID=UPI000358BFF9|nr:FAD:protein FMN transferase [Desulfovibrio sp. X2]EPR38742.1 ApbE family lipoprotein [Desulfovibrio sp. X2]
MRRFAMNRAAHGKPGMSRREFLLRSAGAGICAAAGTLVPLAAGAGMLGRSRTLSLLRPAMGTFVSVSVVDDSRDRAEEAAGRAFDAVARYEPVFSRFAPASPVSVLNERGSLADAPPELAALFAQCFAVHRATNGAFDPTVLPVVELLAARSADGEVRLAPGELAAAEELVGIAGLRCAGRSVRLARSGMAVTLDAIAKGRIVDFAAEAMLAAGAQNFLINAGGDIRAHGSPERGGKWRVAVEDPGGQNGAPAVVELCDGAVATSGSYEVSFDSRRFLCHIVDPGTGRSPGLAAGVTACAPTCAESDALATGLMVLGPAAGSRAVAALPGRSVLFVGLDGAHVASPGFPARG